MEAVRPALVFSPSPFSVSSYPRRRIWAEEEEENRVTRPVQIYGHGKQRREKKGGGRTQADILILFVLFSFFPLCVGKRESSSAVSHFHPPFLFFPRARAKAVKKTERSSSREGCRIGYPRRRWETRWRKDNLTLVLKVHGLEYDFACRE